jgi:hypothetical protein
MKGKGHLGKLGVDDRIILKCILKKQSVRIWTGFNWLKIVSSDCQLFNKDSTACS